jgi:hypothetical protein
MCGEKNCPHDLDDDLDGLFTGGPLSPEEREAGIKIATEAQQMKMHKEPCKSCRGSGRFISYAGRDCGQCFKCKGKGYRMFRQSLAQRERAKELRVARETSKRDQWMSDHPEVMAWINRKADRFDFARSMGEAVNKYGHLTDNQLAACERMMVKDAEREAQWAAEREAKAAAAPQIAIDAILTALLTAKSHIQWPKLRLDLFTFSLAGENSRNAGSVYVKQDETYLGKITDGRFHAGRDCTPELQAAIIAAAANPEEAARAYGLAFGICSCCGRKLTNKLSVELGIGPICRERFGWA